LKFRLKYIYLNIMNDSIKKILDDINYEKKQITIKL